MARRPFTRTEETKLVACIRRFPQIYDYKHKEYKNQDFRDEIWTRISEDVGRSVEDCKKRWRSIRDTNNRLKRAQKVLDKKNPSKWILADQLGFLEKREPNERIKRENRSVPTVSEQLVEASEATSRTKDDRDSEQAAKISYESYEREEMRSQSENFAGVAMLPCRLPMIKSKSAVYAYENKSPEPPEPTENVFHAREEKCRCDEDPVSVFFKSMALSVKRLPPVLIAEAKSKICKIVTDLEIRALLSPSEVVSIVTQDHLQFDDDEDVKDRGNV